MKKLIIFFVIIVIFVGLAVFFINNKQNNSVNNFQNTNIANLNNQNTSSYSSSKVGSNVQSNTNLNENIVTPPVEKKEYDLSSFSTKIIVKDAGRQKNISLACSELNGTILESGSTFSFCKTLGPANPKDGYEKADTFDNDGDVIQEYGGGKCQISSTLYNAVLAVPSLEVVERHPHSGKVTYVEKDKDAAIAYGNIDFKFKNNLPNSIKIYASNDPNNVYIRLVEIK